MAMKNLTTEDILCSTISSNDVENIVPHQLRYPAANIIGSLATVLIALVSILGNTAVVIVSFWSEALRVQTGNLLIVYLSCVDIMTGLFVMIPSAVAVASDDWVLGYATCRIHSSLNYMFACSSSFNLAVISADRAVAVLYPFKYKLLMTTNVMIMLCCLIFLISFTIGLICGIPNWNNYDYYEGVCAMDYMSDTGVYYAFNAGCLFCYFIPAFIIGICNTLIIITARRSEKSVQPLFIRRDNINKTLKESTQDSHKNKTLKSMIVVIITYYICYSPYALSKQVKVSFGTDIPPWFNYMTTILIFVASATNPFIYAILRKDYRDAFKRLPKMLRERF